MIAIGAISRSTQPFIISIISLIISIIGLIVMARISLTANEIATHQAEISKTSTTPEFAYLGFAEKISMDNNVDSYGLDPQFAEVSGYANNISCNAFSRFKIKIGTKAEKDITFGSHTYSEYANACSKLKTIPLDIKGEFIRRTIAIDGSFIVITLGRDPSKDFFRSHHQ